MENAIKVDTVIDPQKLSRLFTEARCAGIVKLIVFANEHKSFKFSSMNIPDPEDLIYGVTDAVMKGFGVEKSFVTRAQAAKMFFGDADPKNRPVPMSGLEIGPFWAADGRRIEATPLQWLDMLYRVKDNIAPAALRMVDSFCNTIVEAETTAAPLDITEL